MKEANPLFNEQAEIPRYVSGGDGKFYKRIPRSDGEYDYEEAEIGLALHPLEDGTFIAVRDTEEAMRARKGSSHQRFFESLSNDPDPRVARRAMKRQDMLQKQFERLAIDRATPPSGPQVMFVKDEKFFDLREQWVKAKERGEEKECEFQPLTSYQHKLITNRGTVIRPLYQGEVGMIGSTVVCLEPGYGTGQSVQVGMDMGRISDETVTVIVDQHGRPIE